jgi:hypothetical protein
VKGTDLKDDPPKFADDVSLFLLGDTGVVFSESAQEIHELNTTATYIWCQIEEGLSTAQLVATLSSTFGFSRRDAERHVRQTIVNWQKRGLLEGVPVSCPPKRQDDKPPLMAAPKTRIPTPAFSNTRCYGLLDRVYRVYCATPEIEAWVHPVLIHLNLSQASETREFTRISVVPDTEGFLITQEGCPTYRCAKLEEIAPVVAWVVLSDALDKAKETLAVHAGAVCDVGRALILPGKAGSGKTTLTAALVHTGLHYLSDDIVLLDLATSKLRGIPFTLGVKESGVGLLADHFPVLNDLPVHSRSDKKQLRYLPVCEAVDLLDSAPRISWIVFPTYDPDGDNRLAPITSREALLQLTKNSVLIRTVTRQQVEDLVGLVKRALCFEIRVSSLEEATRELIGLWDKSSSTGS